MSYQEDVQRYHELIAEGVPPKDAFFSIWPDGLQGTADKLAKEESKKQQGDQLAGVAGTIGGAIATQQAIKHAPSIWGAITGKGAEEVAKEVIKDKVLPSVITGGSGVGGAGAGGLTAPTLVGANVVTPPTVAAPFLGVGALPAAGIGAGIALGGKGLYDLITGKADNSLIGKGGRLTLGLATGGLSELARPGLIHKSTKDYQKERWGDLSQGWQALNPHTPEDDGIWDEGLHAGEKWSWDKAQERAMLNPAELIVTEGNANAFGDQWLYTPQPAQEQIVRRLLEEGLYKSDKGDIVIPDGKQDRARQIYQEITGAGLDDQGFALMSSGEFQAPAQPEPQPEQVNSVGDPSMQNNKMLIQQPGQPQNGLGQFGTLTPEQVQGSWKPPAGSGGYWVDPNGNRVEGIDPGFSAGNRFVPNDPNYLPSSSPMPPQGSTDGAIFNKPSQYPSIREYLAQMGQGTANFGAPMPQGSGGPGAAQPAFAQPGGPSNPQGLAQMQSLGMSQPAMTQAQPAQAQPAQKSQAELTAISQALKRARELRD